jgi:hypothetical protein
MNWECDLYCYYDCDGMITIHIANRKRIGDIPELPPIGEVSDKEWLDAYSEQHKILDSLPLVPIGLPEDGKSFNVRSIKEFRQKLTYLRELGYNFPDYLFDETEESRQGE